MKFASPVTHKSLLYNHFIVHSQTAILDTKSESGSWLAEIQDALGYTEVKTTSGKIAKKASDPAQSAMIYYSY